MRSLVVLSFQSTIYVYSTHGNIYMLKYNRILERSMNKSLKDSGEESMKKHLLVIPK